MKNWVPDDETLNMKYDLACFPFGIFDVNPITKKRDISESHPILSNEHSVSETLEIIKKINSKKYILSHIEEPDNITIDLAKKISWHYSNELSKDICIAHDTMMIDIG